MPRQNRVNPFGEIVRTDARGTLMGNRGGCFHDEQQELRHSRWQGHRWIACLLDFRGRWRPVMQPSRYTELFFLDEATALAAGHRPCAQCRWSDFQRFKAAWLRGNPERGIEQGESIDAIDAHLHRERVDRRQRKVTFRAPADTLPDGVIIALDRSPDDAYIIWQGILYRWSFEAYGPAAILPAGESVTVLTPRSVVEAIVAGYTPAVHASISAPPSPAAPYMAPPAPGTGPTQEV